MRFGGWKSERMLWRYTQINLDGVAHTITAMRTIGVQPKRKPPVKAKVSAKTKAKAAPAKHAAGGQR
jgi:hypothetical protein